MMKKLFLFCILLFYSLFNHFSYSWNDALYGKPDSRALMRSKSYNGYIGGGLSVGGNAGYSVNDGNYFIGGYARGGLENFQRKYSDISLYSAGELAFSGNYFKSPLSTTNDISLSAEGFYGTITFLAKVGFAISNIKVYFMAGPEFGIVSGNYGVNENGEKNGLLGSGLAIATGVGVRVPFHNFFDVFTEFKASFNMLGALASSGILGDSFVYPGDYIGLACMAGIDLKIL